MTYLCGLIMIISTLLLVSPGDAGTVPTGYVVSAGRTLWNASGSSANQGLGSITLSYSGTASCVALTQVAQSDIDNTSFPGSARATIPGSGVYIKAVCSGGGSGGDAVIDLDVTDFVPGNGLIGQWQFFAPGYNVNTNGFKVQMNNSAATARLTLANNSTSTYMRRQEGWNLQQSYCSASLTFPEWTVETGAPTCASTIEKWRIRATITINTTVTFYFGDVIANYYAKPQITIWAADGDNTGYTEVYTYMQTKNMVGSYRPTIGEINQGGNPMSLANLLTMQAAGWSMHGGQSTSVIGNYTALSATALTAEIATVKRLSTDAGLMLGGIYQPPGSATNQAVNAELVRQGFLGVVQGGNVSADPNGRPIYGGLINPLLWNVSGDGNTLAQNIAVIDHAVKYGEAVSILFHKVDGTTTCDQACFRSTIDYLTRLRDANVLDVVTWEQLYFRQFGRKARP